ncbi:hypothetical protein EXVG_00382 [Emiliania huxleyi virus 202]|nr:hypothetical protein EXVG_00382 [Emiliania huxleyi virus 202]AHA54341.1 hypothetical protein EhV18_00295 [Emiliania huxleyi virus 18]
MTVLEFTHFTPSGTAVDVEIKKGDIVSYMSRSGYIKCGPVWDIDGAMFAAGKTRGYIWFSQIRGVNGIELDDFI